jgi:hypothetical protein
VARVIEERAHALGDDDLTARRHHRHAETDHRGEFAAAETGGDDHFRRGEMFGAGADGEAVGRRIDRIDGAAREVFATALQQRRMQRTQQIERVCLAVDRAV